MTEESKPLEQDVSLVTWGDFSKCVPERWRGSPLYVANSIGNYKKAVRLLLVRDAAGRKIIVIDQEYSSLSEACIK